MRSFFGSQSRGASRRAVAIRALLLRALPPLCAVIFVVAFSASPGQNDPRMGQNGPSELGSHGRGAFGSLFDDQNPPFPEKQIKALNEARQKTMIADTDKLLRLARELNAEVSSSGPSSLTPEQLSKIASIEKLAHNVKEKMTESYVTQPMLRDPLQPQR